MASWFAILPQGASFKQYCKGLYHTRPLAVGTAILRTDWFEFAGKTTGLSPLPMTKGLQTLLGTWIQGIRCQADLH